MTKSIATNKLDLHIVDRSEPPANMKKSQYKYKRNSDANTERSKYVGFIRGFAASLNPVPQHPTTAILSLENTHST